MRILYTVGDPEFSLSDSAGYTRHILQCVRALGELGHEVRILTSCSDEGVGQQKQAFGRIKRFMPSAVLAVAKDVRRLMYDSRFETEIEEAVKDFRPDVIYDRLALFHRSAVRTGNRLGIPVILEVNALIAREMNQYYRLGLSSLASRIEKEVYRQTTAIAVVSTQLKRDLVEYGISPDVIFVNPNGVDPHEFNPAVDALAVRQRFDLEGKQVIGFLGSLAPWHGVDKLLDAAQTVCQEKPDARFLIVGSGSQSEYLQQRTRQSGIEDKVVFAGAASHDEVPRYVNAMDIATAPYPHMDRFYFSPIKIFEYMSAERAIVASRLGQIGEVIEDGVTGMLFKAGNVRELADVLIRLLDQPHLRASLGSQARRTVLAKYTWLQNAERIVEAYHRLQL